jgi:hypothetical protein
MTITMNDTCTYSIPELKNLLSLLDEGMAFEAVSHPEAYAWIERTAGRYGYGGRSKKERGVIRAYLVRMTGYSSGQMGKLLAALKAEGKLKRKAYQRNSFTRYYTSEDILLLAKVDRAHRFLSGPATAAILRREYEVFGKDEYERLSHISASHIYNLRDTLRWREATLQYRHTEETKVTLGERRKPVPNGRPGFIRVDCVHQGDDPTDGKGVYHVNFVDEVTQWELVACVPAISDRYMLSVIEAILESFPFAVINFHSDNGSEFVNHKVLALVRKHHARLTKSRARRHNDNALVEGKNAWVIRKHMGWLHIPREHAGEINRWYHKWFNPYLSFHRPCAFPTTVTGKNGKERIVYRKADYQTPYSRLTGLPDWQQYLRPGVTSAMLEKQAMGMSDTDFAEAVQAAKQKLLAVTAKPLPTLPLTTIQPA